MRVLVSGGSSGLGAAVVAAVADAGGKPYIVDLSEGIDVGDTRRAEAAVREIASAAGGLDGVVTAAGIDHPGALEDVPGEQWDRVVAVDLLGTAAVVRAALPYLFESRGHVVTVASTLGMRALPHATAYCAAKFGVVGFTRALAAETAGRIGVTLLVPGGMQTSFFDGRDEQYRPGPDARLNDPRNVAAAVMFALSQPAGCAMREMVLCPDTEPSWP
ncbi:SDR family oxidoreductase [Allorhizocola rhizosphaerae]|uniref:SDR family oxidoreductase n=1 Tax=Allorhizocola rhizosphaerae TaxID=1872709 RepID=UPI000E3C67F7|nr:SDR family oxidoreductase [Allorhizocola rhizosphaerae]